MNEPPTPIRDFFISILILLIKCGAGLVLGLEAIALGIGYVISMLFDFQTISIWQTSPRVSIICFVMLCIFSLAVTPISLWVMIVSSIALGALAFLGIKFVTAFGM